MITGKKYELMTIFLPTLTEKEVEKELEIIKTLIGKTGSIVYEQIWGKRDLYYTLKGQDKGIYTILHFTTQDAIASIPKELKLMNRVMRFLLLELPKNYEVKPFVALEEETEKKETPKEEKKVEKVIKAKKPIEKEEKKEVKKEEDSVVTEEPKEAAKATADTKKKKSSFDEKIDEIIGNLDNL